MRFVLPLLVLACGNPEPEDSGTPAPPLSDLPTAACGTADYDWVALDSMGDLVDWERMPELDTSAAVIRGLLSGAGYPVELLPITYDVRVYRVRYLTQDRGRTVETTGIVSVPDTDGSFPTVAWLHGTTGFSDGCAPSGQGLEGAAGNLLLSSMGAVVAAPDYLGMNGWGEASDMLHPYVIAEPTAVASLDSIRAAWNLVAEDPGIDATAERRTVFFGGSEGGFAALWSERYAPWYLPEAEVVATVASVPPSDVTGLAAHGAEVAGPTTLALAAAMTAHRDWYGYEAPMTDIFTDEDPTFVASTLYDVMDSTCDAGGAFDGISTVEEVYTASFRTSAIAGDWEALGEWGCGLVANSLATSPIPRISDEPVLYVISGADELVYHQTNRDDVPRLCDQGYALEIIECEGASHTDGAIGSLHLQWQWVEDRLDGVPFDAPCALPEPVVCEPG